MLETNNEQENVPPEPTSEELEEKWESMKSGLCDLLQGHGELPDDVIPYDATDDADDELHAFVCCIALLIIHDGINE